MAFADFHRRVRNGVDDAIAAELERVSIRRSLEPHGRLFDQYFQARGALIGPETVLRLGSVKGD